MPKRKLSERAEQREYTLEERVVSLERLLEEELPSDNAMQLEMSVLLRKLAKSYVRMNEEEKLEQALQHIDRALHIQVQKCLFPPDHPEIIRSVETLAEVYYALEEESIACVLWEYAFTQLEQKNADFYSTESELAYETFFSNIATALIGEYCTYDGLLASQIAQRAIRVLKNHPQYADTLAEWFSHIPPSEQVGVMQSQEELEAVASTSTPEVFLPSTQIAFSDLFAWHVRKKQEIEALFQKRASLYAELIPNMLSLILANPTVSAAGEDEEKSAETRLPPVLTEASMRDFMRMLQVELCKQNDHSPLQQAALLRQLGNLHLNMGERYAVKAFDYVMHALLLQKQHLAEENIEMAITYANLSKLYAMMWNREKSSFFLEKALLLTQEQRFESEESYPVLMVLLMDGALRLIESIQGSVKEPESVLSLQRVERIQAIVLAHPAYGQTHVFAQQLLYLMELVQMEKVYQAAAAPCVSQLSFPVPVGIAVDVNQHGFLAAPAFVSCQQVYQAVITLHTDICNYCIAQQFQYEDSQLNVFVAIILGGLSKAQTQEEFASFCAQEETEQASPLFSALATYVQSHIDPHSILYALYKEPYFARDIAVQVENGNLAALHARAGMPFVAVAEQEKLSELNSEDKKCLYSSKT